jgi:Tol biopolymer transport system component
VRGRLTTATLIGVLIAVVIADVASATFPGANGKIVYTRQTFDGDLLICTIDPDGTGKVCPPGTSTWFHFATPAWSPDGQKILYVDFGHVLKTVDGDLTNQTFVRENVFIDQEWSPATLAKLVFTSTHTSPPVLATSNLDGTGFEQLPPADDCRAARTTPRGGCG